MKKMPPPPAKANRILLPEEDFPTRSTDAEIVHPSSAVDANDARVTANCVAWLLKISPAQGPGTAFSVKATLLMSVVCLQGNDSWEGTSVGGLTGW